MGDPAARDRGIPDLNDNNWPAWKDELFKEAMKYGDARKIIMENRDVEIRVPKMTDREGAGGPYKYRNIEGDDETGSIGKVMFTEAVKLVPKQKQELIANKEKLIHVMLSHLSTGVETKVKANPEFGDAFRSGNLLKVWQIVEFTATGQGAHSIGVDLTALLKLKQHGNDFAKYLTSFRERIAAITRSGKTAAQLWALMLNVIFILGLSQEMFARQLDEVYSKVEWPDYDELAAVLLRHTTVIDSIERMAKDNPDGIVSANVASTRSTTAGGERYDDDCHNCGRKGHRRSDCPEKPSKCDGCGERGHMQKYCAIVQRYAKSRARSASGQGSRGSTHEKKGTKPSKVNERFKKAAALAADISESISELEHHLGDEQEELSSEDDGEYGKAGVTSFAARVHGAPMHKSRASGSQQAAGRRSVIQAKTVVVMAEQRESSDESCRAMRSLEETPVEEIKIKIDSGCVGGAVVNDPRMLSQPRRSSATIQGISGDASKATLTGQMPVVGKSFLLENAYDCLAPLKSFTQQGFTCIVDDAELKVVNGPVSYEGSVVLSAPDTGDGFYTVTYGDLLTAETAVRALPAEVQDQPVGAAPDPIQHFSADQRKRAAGYREWHNNNGHPSDYAAAQAFRNGSMRNCHFTVQDIRNAKILLGPCPACTEGKMTAPSKISSLSAPAQRPGEHLHADFIFLRDVSVGGNTVILFTVDEHCGYIYGVPMKGKKLVMTEQGFRDTVFHYNSYKHRVDKVSTDRESVFVATRTPLGKLGVMMQHTPAGLNENVSERYIQTIKARRRTILASLPYELPSALEGELYMHCISAWDVMPNTVSGALSPMEIVTGRKPASRPYSFGLIGIFYKKGDDSVSRIGIFCGYNEDYEQSFRVYDPTPGTSFPRGKTYSARKFTPIQSAPASWGLKFRQRMVPIAPAINLEVQNGMPITLSPTDVDDDAIPSGPTTITAVWEPSEDREGVAAAHPSALGPEHQEGEYEEGGGGTIPQPVGAVPSQEPGSPSRTHQEPPRHSVTFSEPPQAAPTPIPRRRMSMSEARTPLQDSRTTPAVSSAPALEAPISPASVSTPAPHVASSPPRSAPPVPRLTQPQSPIPSLQMPSRPPTSVKTETQQKPVAPAPAIKTERPPKTATTNRVKPGAQPSVSGREALRRSTREKDYVGSTKLAVATDSQDQVIRAMRMSITQAMKDKGMEPHTVKAIAAEIENLLEMKAGPLVRYEDIPHQYRGEIVNAFMFLVDKFKAKGEFEKRKGRMVSGKTTKVFEETSSPTVNPITVMTMLHEAAALDYEIAAYDFRGAFLGTPIDKAKDGRIFIRIPKDVTKFWVLLHPEAAEFVDLKGHMYMELDKYLYGLPPSGSRFHEFVKKIFTQEGATISSADKCALVIKSKVKPGEVIKISMHVDDLLMTFPTLKDRKYIEAVIRRHFEITTQYDDITYLGIFIKRNRAQRTVHIDQEGFTRKLVETFGGSDLKPASTPAKADLFECDPASPKMSKPQVFVSLIMSLMYLARLTRCEILLPTVFLSTKCSSPTEQDYHKARHILRYLKGTPKRGITLGGKGPDVMKPRFIVDTSHGVHMDGKGQLGLIIMLGIAVIFCRSCKLKAVTLSSTESEVYGLSDSVGYALWFARLLNDFGYSDVCPMETWQDNQSAMHMQTTGSGRFSRSKHIFIRDCFVKEHIDNGEIVLKYVPTEDMLADMLTKPLDKAAFNRLVKRMFTDA